MDHFTAEEPCERLTREQPEQAGWHLKRRAETSDQFEGTRKFVTTRAARGCSGRGARTIFS